jgi:DNA-binding transcriptional MerR regulator
MRMEQRTFRIGELAKLLNVKRFVIRFWEKEFALSPVRSSGGQRFYTGADFNRFKAIKELLYAKGYTIAGARKALTKNRSVAPASKTTFNETEHNVVPSIDELQTKLALLQQQLQKLLELL